MILTHPVTYGLLKQWPFRPRDMELINRFGGVGQLRAQLDVDKPALAFTRNGVPLLAAGLAIMENGEAEVWSFPTDHMADHLLEVVRHGRRLLRVAMRLYQVHTINALIETDWEEAKRFARLFGFLPCNQILEPTEGLCFECWQKKEF